MLRFAATPRSTERIIGAWAQRRPGWRLRTSSSWAWVRAGRTSAGRLAEAGLDVVGIEAELVGGECPYWGCVPSKMMIRAADALAEARRVDGLAGHASVTPDWAPVAQRIRAEATDTWDDTVAADRFTGKGGRLVRGRAASSVRASVEVAGTTYVARGRSSSTPGRRRRSRRSLAWPGRRTGPTVARSRPRRCPRRSSCSAGGPSASSWRRCLRGSGRPSRSSRWRTGCSPWRSLRRQPWCPPRSSVTASTCGSAYEPGCFS